jgi:fatty-acyl-CoA synthase
MLEDQVALARIDLASGQLVRDANGRCVPCVADEPGEILGKVGLAGSMEYDGYTDREATEKKLVRDAFAPDDAWFRSGDLLRRDSEGYYYFLDRIGDTFRWKGENVATMEVSDRLSSAPGVTEANVFGVTVPGEDGRAGMAAIVLRDGASFDGPGFFAYAEKHLPRYAMPAFVRVLRQAMDVTGTLKQRKLSLVGDGWDPTKTTDALYVRDDAGSTYVPLTAERVDSIRRGALRL